jgi:hypothetical protein
MLRNKEINPNQAGVEVLIGCARKTAVFLDLVYCPLNREVLSYMVGCFGEPRGNKLGVQISSFDFCEA